MSLATESRKRPCTIRIDADALAQDIFSRTSNKHGAMMSDFEDRIEEMLADLKQQRDELRVKLSLAKLEASDEWREIEGKLRKLEAKAREVGGATADASKDVFAAAKLLGDEIRKGLKSVAKHF
jgi:Mg2+ and Co2+ transporter CorA